MSVFVVVVIIVMIIIALALGCGIEAYTVSEAGWPPHRCLAHCQSTPRPIEWLIALSDRIQ